MSSYTWGKRIAENMIQYNVPSMRDELALGVEFVGSIFSWVMTSLVDAPMEMLRHQTQVTILSLVCMEYVTVGLTLSFEAIAFSL